MNPEEKLERLVEEYCRENKSRVRSTDDYDRRVHADIDRALEKAKRAESAEQQMNMWRLIMKSKITKYAAAAVIVIGFLTAIIMFTGPETEPGGPVAGSGGGQGDGAFVSDSGQDSDDRLTAESGQIEKMYAAGDVDGLVAMLPVTLMVWLQCSIRDGPRASCLPPGIWHKSATRPPFRRCTPCWLLMRTWAKITYFPRPYRQSRPGLKRQLVNRRLRIRTLLLCRQPRPRPKAIRRPSRSWNDGPVFDRSCADTHGGNHDHSDAGCRTAGRPGP